MVSSALTLALCAGIALAQRGTLVDNNKSIPLEECSLALQASVSPISTFISTFTVTISQPAITTTIFQTMSAINTTLVTNGEVRTSTEPLFANEIAIGATTTDTAVLVRTSTSTVDVTLTIVNTEGGTDVVTATNLVTSTAIETVCETVTTLEVDYEMATNTDATVKTVVSTIYETLTVAGKNRDVPDGKLSLSKTHCTKKGSHHP